MIRTVIFDLGGVLIDWNPDYVFKTIFSDEKELKWFYEHICTPDWNEEQDAGRDLSEATEMLVKQFPDHEQNIRAYYGRWEEMLKGPIHDTVEIFRELKEGGKYHLLALTNWSHQTFPIALERFDFLHWFHGRVVSGEERTRKPFRDIYMTLITRYDVDPRTAVYIDDNERNLVTARELGMQTIHFRDPAGLKEALKKIGVELA
jgi:2-haloacid dehalogenase